MTIQTAQFSPASSLVSAETFPTFDHGPAPRGQTQPAQLYVFHVSVIDSDETEHTREFERLGQTLENNPEDAKKLATARAAVAERLYEKGRDTLASLRMRAGLSQRQLADKLQKAQPHISRFEAGTHEPLLNLANDYAQVLGVTLEKFFEAWKRTQASRADRV